MFTFQVTNSKDYSNPEYHRVRSVLGRCGTQQETILDHPGCIL